MINKKSSSKTVSAPPKSKPKKPKPKKKYSLTTICFAITAILIIISSILIIYSVQNGAVTAKEAYEKAKSKATEDSYNKFYKTAYTSAERKYHVSNNVSIEVESVREKANLEVLKVCDVEYVIKSKETNNDDVEAWLEFYGDGVYTVDMKTSEFIIDSVRQHVLVRVPRPELTNCRITQTKELLYKNNKFFGNGSISEGTSLAVDMRNAGFTKLNNYMKSNAQFYKSAKNSAKTIIANLVKGLNPDLPNLIVEVEFVD